MKVLVTGATGFIGNQVVTHLLQYYQDIEIVATSTADAKAKKFESK